MGRVSHKRVFEMKVETAEEQNVQRLIRLILQDGNSISIYDGEEYAIQWSQNEAAILTVMGATDEDMISVFDSNKKMRGWIYLVYGNAADEVVCDYSANPYIESLVDAAIPVIEDNAEEFALWGDA